MHRLVLPTVLLVILAACGNSPDARKDSEPDAASTTKAVALEETCAKLGRTWTVAADKLDTSLTVAAMDSVNSATGGMTAASDQMTIEQCEGPMVGKMLEGNYEAAVAAAEALSCSREPEITVCPAGEAWRSKGEPIVAEVRELAKR